jgi:hypothetical protein
MISSYKELTIGKFQELHKVDWMSKEDIDKQVTMIAILNDMTEEEVLLLPIPKYTKLASNTAFLQQPPKPHNKIPNKFKINDNEYVLLSDVRDMTAGQYIDYQQYVAADDLDLYLPYIISCFLIPKGKKYGEYNIDAVIDEIRNYLSVEEALSIANFFTKKSQNLTRATLFCLEWKMKRARKKMKDETMKNQMTEAIMKVHSLRNLIKNGGGFPL